MAYLSFSVIICLFGFITSLKIKLEKCDPPDYPLWGGYGPIQNQYEVGDHIHYFCSTDSYIGGNYYRRCEDNGEWFGDTPVCDTSARIKFVNQTSTEEPEDENEAELVTDEDRTTCSTTSFGPDQYWMGIFEKPGELIRVMVFMPPGEVAYQVLLLNRDGSELSCGSKTGRNDHLGWEFHNCPGPNNRDAIGVKIKSLSSNPLQICEMAAHVLVSPTCVDPKLRIDDGVMQVSRKTASLICNPHFTPGRARRIECIRDGVWNRKTLHCRPPPWEIIENNDQM